MQLELSSDDRDLLVQLVERTLSETRVEVRHTSDRALREKLRAEEDRLREVLGRLRGLG